MKRNSLNYKLLKLCHTKYKEIIKDYSDIELILTTIHLQEKVPIKSLLVSAMFTMDDQYRLQRKVEEIYHER